jgi:hypothetical protein
MGGKVQIVQQKPGGWRKASAVLATVTALVAGGLVGSGGVLLGPIQPAAAAVPFPNLAANATWLQTVNAWRAASGLPAVTESTATTPTWSEGALKHSTYIVETGDFAHTEQAFLDPPTNTMPNPWYSVEGAEAGANGNVAASSDATKTDRKFVEQWITAPFHAAGMLDPMLQTTGFGSYRRVGATPYPAAATLDVIRGRTGAAPITPTFFPGDDSTLPVAQQVYRGGESPDPLSHCPGYNPGGGAAINTGTPLFVLMPKAPDVAVATTAVVKRNGVAVESCTYDENTYTNPVPDDQTTARGVMASRHQAVVIPRLPLVQGSVYTVDVTVTYATELVPTVLSWEFTTDALPRISIGNASVVEGNARARQVKLTVTLQRPSQEAISVSYATVSGTATAGSDFLAKSGVLTIPPGGTSGIVTIMVKGDRTAEPQETFTVRLTNPQNARLWRTTGIGTIINDDNPTVAPVRVSIGSASVVEGDVGTRALRFAVTLSASSPNRAVSVDYDTEEDWANSADFREASGTLTIPARAVSGVILVRIKAEKVIEDTEKFTVELSDPRGATLHPTRSVGTGTISDDD